MSPFYSQKILKSWETGYCSLIDEGGEVGWIIQGPPG